MALLIHLFGSKKGIVKELVMDDKKRMALWDEHLSNHRKREELSKHFNYANVDKALEDFKATDEVFRKIEALISPELVNIANEEKTDKEILRDLKRLKSTSEIDKLGFDIVRVKQKQPKLLKLFQEIHNILKAELHLIRLIRKKPEKDLLLKLFEIIFNQEALLYRVFREQFFLNKKDVHTYIMKIARAIILEEEIKEEVESDEEKFAKKMVKQIVKRMEQDEDRDPDESVRGYRKVAEDIYEKISKKAYHSLGPKGDVVDAMELIFKFIENDKIIYNIIKKLKPKYDDAKIKIVIMAFRESFNRTHFDQLEEAFCHEFHKDLL